MQALRDAMMPARLVLAWFVLTLGAAIASPLVRSQTMELVCSAAVGVKMVAVDQDGQPAPPARHALDCPMCLTGAPPAALPESPKGPQRLLAYVSPPVVATHVAVQAGAPLPPRGPPALS